MMNFGGSSEEEQEEEQDEEYMDRMGNTISKAEWERLNTGTAGAEAEEASVAAEEPVSVESARGPRKPFASRDESALLQVALEKQERGESLSNKERRRIASHEQSKALAATLEESSLDSFAIVLPAGACEAAAVSRARDIVVPEFGVSAPGKELFANAQLKLAAGKRYGLVGPNGMGKTTLMKMVAQKRLPVPGHLHVLLVDQEVPPSEDSCVQSVLGRDVRRKELLEAEAQLVLLLEGEGAEHRDAAWWTETCGELQRVSDAIEAHGCDGAESRVRRILSGLGFVDQMPEQPVSSLSGGWRMRLSLASALFLEPEVLLLDEPTNHLDLLAVMWLDEYLCAWRNTLVVVSHDADFLDSVCTNTIHLDSKALRYYEGGFSQFESRLAENRRRDAKEFHNQTQAVKQLTKSGMSKADALAKVAEDAARKNRKPGQSGEEGPSGILEKHKDYVVRFQFLALEDNGPAVSLHDVGFAYESGRQLLKKVNLGVDSNSRVAIVGPNGAGKSTLLRLITGELEPCSGEVDRHRALRLGVFNQHFEGILPFELTPTQYLESAFKIPADKARGMLGKFGLPGKEHGRRIEQLSGGQKARVVFASLTAYKPHILVLDEPTNHLDMESVQALCQALQAYEGGVVLVTHDARLIQETKCQLWVLDNGGVRPYPAQAGRSSFESYRRHVIHKMRQQEQRALEEAQALVEQRQLARKERVEAKTLARAIAEE